MPQRITVQSPAKVNLFLHVTRRRPDGYHDLVSLFERISLADKITLSEAKQGIHLSVSSRSIPADARNIAWKAAELLQNEYGVRTGVKIHIQKNIPVSAGLGGGSSNAAAVLLGLNRLWRLKLSRKKLLELGFRIGSDVPFFILEQSFAMADGRGEKLKPLKLKNFKIWHCLVKPPFGISTREAYQALDPSTLTPLGPDVKMLIHSIRRGDSKALQSLLTNSLEAVLNNRVRTISKIKRELLQQGALGSLMSGSGSTVFGIFLSKTTATRAAATLRRKNSRWQVFVACTY